MNKARLLIFVLFVQILNLTQSFFIISWKYGVSRQNKIYLAICLALLLFTLVYVMRNKSITAQIKIDFQRLQSLPLPRPVKWLTVVVLLGNLVVILLGKTIYPFADVGMFRHAKNVDNLESSCTLPRYFFKDKDGTIHWLHLRKEHIFFLSDYLGWGYNNEFTFSAAYHYKGNARNFEYISEIMKRHGYTDTLWVGTQTVDYTTGKISYDSSLCAIEKLNESSSQYYGSTYVPPYQRKYCPE